MTDTPDLLPAAVRLATAGGRPAPVRLTQLAGGKNNRVFRADGESGPPLVLKSYFFDPRDGRDRLAAEWAFLSHVHGRGITSAPEPIALDTHAHLGLYGFLPGRKLRPEEVGAREVEAAFDFVRDVNAPPRAPRALPPGSEACFTLRQHLATVSRRVGRLATLDPDAPLRAEAERFVADRLTPFWRSLEVGIAAEATAAGLDLDEPLGEDRLILSPSDFGFHNALLEEDGVLRFLDFEYAGYDDPAKLVCDFFCQPETPAPPPLFPSTVRRLAADLDFGQAFLIRCRLLIDAYRVKWACIILNDFLPLGAARRAFALPGDVARRQAQQLRKAAEQLDQTTAR